MATFEFEMTVPGDPVVKGRPRFTRYGKAYTPKATVEKERAVALIAQERIQEPYGGRLGVEVDFYCATMRRTDGDNLMKLVLDALNTVVYTDDYLVEDVHYRVHRKAPDQEPRTEIYFFSLDD